MELISIRESRTIKVLLVKSLIHKWFILLALTTLGSTQEYDYEDDTVKAPKTHIIQIIHHHHHPLDYHGHLRGMAPLAPVGLLTSGWPLTSSNALYNSKHFGVGSGSTSHSGQGPPGPPPGPPGPPPAPPIPASVSHFTPSTSYSPHSNSPHVHHLPPIHHSPSPNQYSPPVSGYNESPGFTESSDRPPRPSERIRKWWNSLLNRNNSPPSSSSSSSAGGNNGYPTHNTYDPYFTPPPPNALTNTVVGPLESPGARWHYSRRRSPARVALQHLADGIPPWSGELWIF